MLSVKKYMILSMVLLLISIPSVMAGNGTLRIDPAWPVMVESPADFTVWCQSGTSYDVSILLVITQDCYDAMPGSGAVVTVESDADTIEIYKAAFDINVVTGMGGVYVPDSGATTGARYTVASLKDHLDYGLSEPLESDDTIRWYMAYLFDELGEDPEDITITLNSGTPRMLVYLLGKSEDGAELFDMKVPPTIPGFVLPELGTIMAAVAMFTALGLFVYKKKHTQTK